MMASMGAIDSYDDDSQWVGQGATQGHYVDLTEFMTSMELIKPMKQLQY
jgi:hypothetical protein